MKPFPPMVVMPQRPRFRGAWYSWLKVKPTTEGSETVSHTLRLTHRLRSDAGTRLVAGRYRF